MRFHTLVLVAYIFVHAQATLASDTLLLNTADCGNPFQNPYGPFDYRTATPAQKRIVEMSHFNADVESLRAGISGPIGAEIDYTLRAFPNHPRALMAMMRLAQRQNTAKPRGAHWPVECYMQRAVQFRPDDMQALHIRGVYYSTHHRFSEAIADFTTVVKQRPNDAGAHYNLGLAYFETKDYDRAQQEARIAKSLGFPLPGLTNKLKSVGRSTE